MIPFHHSSSRPIRNLPKLIEAYNTHGGAIIKYQRVVSCIFLSQKSSHIVWVPPHRSAALKSWPDTLITLLLGWWSLFGVFWTIEALISNLGGGEDVTEELLRATRGGDVAFAQRAIDDAIRARRQQSLYAVAAFIVIFGGIGLFFWGLIRIVEWQMDKPRPAIAAKPLPQTGPSSSPAEPRRSAARPSVVPFRLQAIFYQRNGRSTAIINGRTVSVGEHIGDNTVYAIEPQSVSLQSAGGRKIFLQVGGAGR